MRSSIDDVLECLAKGRSNPALEGLENEIWVKVQAKKDSARSSSVGVRVTLTLAALSIGLVLGAAHLSQPSANLSEMRVLSEDGAFAPSVRLGG